MDETLLTVRQRLSQIISLRKNETDWFETDGDKMVYKGNPYYLNLAGEDEGIRKQLLPTVEELTFLEIESADPLFEKMHSPLPRMVHRYSNRVAILVTDRCSVHCRHCFRRSFTGTGHADLTMAECDRMIAYIKIHPEIQEVLLTGGDPLTLENVPLLDILSRFRSVRDNLIIRLATRIPAVLPLRIDFDLARELEKMSPLWIVMQFNHPSELTDESRTALRLLRQAGIPMVNQAVLLRGVNDNSDTLASLFQGLMAQGVKPYYLFQGDLARGTSHFRVPLRRGWQIMDELRQKVSGLALPTYAVDLPGGGGKIPLTRSLLLREDEKGYVFINTDKREYTYPREEV
ncbi:KamA family radical SAM protein [Oceanispirochaeta sp.]|jgi:lysine 2,3-aminomutase|uniref:KamA family radical SAM protein n=1 Tax=Oceanispirochaeta sp. TaxID=2035350 RepID=UPI002628C6AC|nr:KamA family radical SAM protein [Oceanispirochaeta sp.]MDA3958922.1 KamA family radical SAM protein [Oceanispirochaeta sp.]